MKIPIIKKLAESKSLEDLRDAEGKLYAEETLPFDVEGEDSGEQLTHILGAIWILEECAKGKEFKLAFREFTERVRKSIN